MRISRTSTVPAVVREWDDEAGWGVLDCAETPGGCFGHFSDIVAEGFRSLSAGQRVQLTWEAPGQDGYAYRAVRIIP
ncbi:cold shock domain-containing protein [Streptomyces sp. RKAG293]|uniref:cold-shock protein n=1 Tax=Streptomyces sp. RKAG293 TaxID=2893403 RepID=UPI0020334CA3|nr:cold shock domain-containing protein [Streptomyces sp. RKAG293]MCM2423038.1 cold shock domain-containing protein [Streptomyces sp. RKAG293]